MSIFAESMALGEISEQVYALDKSLRSILTEVEERAKSYQADKIESEEDQYWNDLAAESLFDDYAVAKSVVESSMGVIMVLLHSHIEAGLKRIFKSTRPGSLNGVDWNGFLAAYSVVGIDLKAKQNFEVVDSIRNLSNCYKHDSGRPKGDLLLPDGTVTKGGAVIDYSQFNYPALADAVVVFLKSVSKDASSPAAPRGVPEIEFTILSTGEHRLRHMVAKHPLLKKKHWDVEVRRLVCDGTMKKPIPVGLVPAKGKLELPPVKTGVKVIYFLRYSNSRNEKSKIVREEVIQP